MSTHPVPAAEQCLCPECGEAAESYEFKSFTVVSAEMYRGVFISGTERRVRIPQGEPEYTLHPCGHQVYTITVTRKA